MWCAAALVRSASCTVLPIVLLLLPSWLPCSLFFHKEMELSLIGLQNAGKTSLVNVLTTGQFHEVRPACN